MIRSFKHKGLKAFFEKGAGAGLNPKMLGKIRRVLARLDAATDKKDLEYPAAQGLHQLKGNLKGYFAVAVTGNRRIIFKFKDGDIYDVNLIDYH
ncbi:type II toxin-antitoxin system RelE/ParE family toxin [Oligoflexia bacterium]|nr:type II toxin-antitoxin system RelE/ParE family toxin [Oligoflexia bacterium]